MGRDTPRGRAPHAACNPERQEGLCSAVADFYRGVPWYFVWILVLSGLADVGAMLHYDEPVFLMFLLLWAWMALCFDRPHDPTEYPRALLWPASVYLFVYIPPAQSVLESFEKLLRKLFLVSDNSLMLLALALALIATLLAAGERLWRTRSIPSTLRAAACAFLLTYGLFPLLFGGFILFYITNFPH